MTKRRRRRERAERREMDGARRNGKREGSRAGRRVPPEEEVRRRARSVCVATKPQSDDEFQSRTVAARAFVCERGAPERRRRLEP